jgi:PAS domain S-box-containing protein
MTPPRPPLPAETVVTHASLALLLVDGAQRCTYLNPAAERLTGLALAGGHAQPLHEALAHAQADGSPCPGAGCALRLALSGLPGQRWEVQLLAGGARLVELTASPVLEGGEARGAVLTLRELAAEASARAALSESEERYRFLAENIPVQVWTARPDGMLDYVTHQTADYFGLTPERLLAEGWQNVVHPDDLGLAVERWVHALGTGCVYEVEFRLRMPDGSYAWHLARAVPQRNARGELVRWFGTNTNIEEQREQRRRTQALVEEVAEQMRVSEEAFRALQRRTDAADARIAELEARQAG